MQRNRDSPVKNRICFWCAESERLFRRMIWRCDIVYPLSIGQNLPQLEKNLKKCFAGGGLAQARSGRNRKAHEKSLRRQPFAAFALQFQNPQRALTATDDDARLVG